MKEDFTYTYDRKEGLTFTYDRKEGLTFTTIGRRV
jgi:hypothetical protein